MNDRLSLLRTDEIDARQLLELRYGSGTVEAHPQGKAGLLTLTGLASGIIASFVQPAILIGALPLVGAVVYANRPGKYVVSIPLLNGGTLRLRRRDIELAQLIRRSDGSVELLVHQGTEPNAVGDTDLFFALSAILRTLASDPATQVEIDIALDQLRDATDPRAYLEALASKAQPDQVAREYDANGREWQLWNGRLSDLERFQRLALRILADEECERLALASKAHHLAREWQRAEEIASIADDLLAPLSLRTQVRALRDRSRKHTD